MNKIYKILLLLCLALGTSCSHVIEYKTIKIINQEKEQRKSDSEFLGDLKKHIGSVHVFSNDKENSSSQGEGSGIYISYKNKVFFLTNNHVCSNNSTRQVFFMNLQTSNGDSDLFIGNMNNVILSKENDICLIPIQYYKQYNKIIPLILESEENTSLDSGEYCFFNQNNNGRSKQVFKHCGRYIGNDSFDIIAIPGDSGSPIFSSKNVFIGIVNSIRVGFDNYSTHMISKSKIIKTLDETLL